MFSNKSQLPLHLHMTYSLFPYPFSMIYALLHSVCPCACHDVEDHEFTQDHEAMQCQIHYNNNIVFR